MKALKAFFGALFFGKRFYLALAMCSFIFVLSYFFQVLYLPSLFVLVVISLLTILDVFILFKNGRKIEAVRDCAEKFSNGDYNPIRITISNYFPFPVTLRVYDECPLEFQIRDLKFNISELKPGTKTHVDYLIKPSKRGLYKFGNVIVTVRSPLKLAERKIQTGDPQSIKVYPSYIQMRKYELMAIHNRLQMEGIKKIRRMGQNREFEHITNYTLGDDIRTINWKATARRNNLMVNKYIDEKAQLVYSIINMGRLMKMPFENLSLLDYSINATLAISNIALKKEDRVGLLTFAQKIDTFIKAEKQSAQLKKINDALYFQKTGFLESNYAALFNYVSKRITQRSLILLFTNFESMVSLERELPFLVAISKRHLLITIIFKNTELQHLLENKPKTTEEIYTKTIAEQFDFEKRMIVKELAKYGIQSILTEPQQLSINTINKYLELKAKGQI